MTTWLGGKIVEDREARIAATDHGLLYGDGVFEGIRAQGGRVVDLDLHLQRLQRSAGAIYLELGAWVDRLRGVVLDTLAAHGKPDAYVRLLVTRGPGRLGLDASSCSGPEVFCIVDSIELFPPETLSQGIRLVTGSWRRPGPDVLDPRVKSLNYLNNVLNKHEAKLRGGDDALVLNTRGTVAEASAANVFVRRGQELWTPPGTDGALEGLTRRRVMLLAPELELRPSERTLSRYDLLDADEVFLTGTGAGLVPVRSLDACRIGASRSESVLPKLRRRLAQYAAQHGVPVLGLCSAE